MLIFLPDIIIRGSLPCLWSFSRTNRRCHGRFVWRRRSAAARRLGDPLCSGGRTLQTMTRRLPTPSRCINPCKLIVPRRVRENPNIGAERSCAAQRAFCAVARPTRCPKPRYSSKGSVAASPPPRGEPYWRKTAPYYWAASLCWHPWQQRRRCVASTDWPAWHHDTSSSSCGSQMQQTTRHSRRRRSRRRRRPRPRPRGTTRKPARSAATRRKGKTTTRTAARSGTGCPASATTR